MVFGKNVGPSIMSYVWLGFCVFASRSYRGGGGPRRVQSLAKHVRSWQRRGVQLGKGWPQGWWPCECRVILMNVCCVQLLVVLVL